MPLPGTRVIHPDWSEHHRPVVAGTLNAVCDVTRADPDDPGGFDPATGETIPPGRLPVATGQGCRVQSAPALDRSHQTTGDQAVNTNHYLVVLPWPNPGYDVDDLVQLTSSPEDESLLGHPLTVLSVQRGSYQWETDLLCIDNQG